MRDVIQKVMAAENEAKQLVQAARAEAVKLLSAAQNQARERLENARRTARAEAAQILAKADANAQREKNIQLDHAASEIRAAIRLDESTRQGAVTAGLRIVCGGKQEARL